MPSVTLLLVLASTALSYAQTSKPSPFQQVAVPTTVRKQLNDFIRTSDNGEAESPLYIRNILADKDLKFNDGIYYFRVMGPHAEGHAFIASKSQITILSGHNTQELVQSFLTFLTEHPLAEKDRVKYLKGLASFVEGKYKAENE